MDKPTDVLVKLKVDKPAGKKSEPGEATARKEQKECCCNKQQTKKFAVSDILMCGKKKSKPEMDEPQKSGSRSRSCAVQDQKTETNGSVDAATQSNVNLQASKSNQTASQVSVSSGKDSENKSNQTNAEDSNNRKSVVSIKEPETTTVNLIEDDSQSKFKTVANPSETRKSDVDVELARTESKHQRKRREGWDKLEKRRR